MADNSGRTEKRTFIFSLVLVHFPLTARLWQVFGLHGVSNTVMDALPLLRNTPTPFFLCIIQRKRKESPKTWVPQGVFGKGFRFTGLLINDMRLLFYIPGLHTGGRTGRQALKHKHRRTRTAARAHTHTHTNCTVKSSTGTGPGPPSISDLRDPTKAKYPDWDYPQYPGHALQEAHEHRSHTRL